jgi:hypothetical protein
MSEDRGVLRHPLIVAIIGSLAVSGILAVLHYAGVTVKNAVAWSARVLAFWGADVTVSRWGFWLWVVFTIGLVLIVALRLYFFLTEESSEAQPAQPQKRNATQPHQAYVTDVFFEFRWRWKTAASGQVWDMSMYCPKCDQQLLSSDFERYRYDAHLCRCSHCNYVKDVSGSSPLDMHDKIKLAAERKIRTGEWEKAVKPAKSTVRQ